MDATNYFNTLSGDAKTDFLSASVNLDDDKFDELGRNVSAQARRQKLVPWVLVDRQRVPVEDPPQVKRARAAEPRLVVD